MADQEQTPEEPGGLTQDEIDAALGGSGAESAPEPADSAVLSQADIDAALAAGATSEPAQPVPTDDGTLSQADIDAALAGEVTAERAEAAAPDVAASEPVANADLTQADIDAALAEVVAADTADQKSAPPPDTRVDATGRPFDAAAAAMAAAIEEERAAVAAGPAPPETSSVELPDFTAGGDKEEEEDHSISLIQDVDLRVKIELGRTRMLVEDVLELGDGSVVELDKLAGDPVDVFVNDRLIARGEVLVLNDNFCVRISEIVSDADARQVG